MSKETAGQINAPQTGSISKTEVFIYDQCVECKANIGQQLIEEIVRFLLGEISEEKLAENLGMNFYELDELLGRWQPCNRKVHEILKKYRNDVECSKCGSIISITLNQLTEILGGNNSRRVSDDLLPKLS